MWYYRLLYTMGHHNGMQDTWRYLLVWQLCVKTALFCYRPFALGHLTNCLVIVGSVASVNVEGILVAVNLTLGGDAVDIHDLHGC